ncbi:MAG: site-2 protease family protein [Limisphaerales bacterium]
MKWSYKLMSVAGTDVKIHVTFFLLLGWVGLTWLPGGVAAAIGGMIFVCLLFACVLLHEFGHVFAAKYFGVRTPDITLYPIGGVARLERMPEKPSQELIVALAGPAVNVVIAMVLFVLVGVSAVMDGLTNPVAPLLVQLAVVNVWLVLFNMIPAFPMDGGRVLRSVLAMKMSHHRATEIAAKVGKYMALALGLAGLLYSPMLIVIAVVVYFGASQELLMSRIKQQGGRTWPFGDLFGGGRPRPQQPSAGPRSSGASPVIDDSGNVVGWVDEERQQGPRAKVYVHRP